MTDEVIVNDNTSNIEETQPDNGNGTVVDNTPTLEDYQELQAKYAKLEETNKHLYARTQKTPKLETKENPSNDKLERLELRVDGYSDAEVDFILKNGGKSALENNYVKTAIEGIRKQNEAEKATEIQSATQSDIEKQYSENDLRGKSVEELEAILPRS